MAPGKAPRKVQMGPRQRRRAGLGGRKICASPGGHHDERGDPRFDQDGIVARERGKSFAWYSQRLGGAAHAGIAFRGAEWSAVSSAWTLIMRRAWMASTTQVANTSAPPATCDTVLITMPVIGWGASIIHCRRIRYAAKPRPSWTINSASSNCAGLRKCGR